MARSTRRDLLPAWRMAGSSHPLQDAAAASLYGSPSGMVVELPESVPANELIGAFADFDDRTRLLGLVCVADAVQVLRTLYREDYLALPGETEGGPMPVAPRAELAVAQIEYASTIVLVNAASLPTDQLAVVMALLSHLSPQARILLDGVATETPGDRDAYAVEQDRPGWVRLLNDEFAPPITDRRVSAFRYEQFRPLHPGRLRHLLDRRIELGEFGRVIRSAGFCRFATRPGVVADWEQVGHLISFGPLVVEDDLEADDELLAIGQDLAIIGLDLDRPALTAALDEASLTDEELIAGPAAWVQLPDPFPDWSTSTPTTGTGEDL
ncbi:MAG: GTP-binding protein [Acidipropionibacterium sp.]|nr:GTP-binding protein [Acidipropionibacterium sp.]